MFKDKHTWNKYRTCKLRLMEHLCIAENHNDQYNPYRPQDVPPCRMGETKERYSIYVNPSFLLIKSFQQYQIWWLLVVIIAIQTVSILTGPFHVIIMEIERCSHSSLPRFNCKETFTRTLHKGWWLLITRFNKSRSRSKVTSAVFFSSNPDPG